MPIKKIKRTFRKTKYVLYKETLVDFREHFWAFLGSFIGIGIIAYLQSDLSNSDQIFLIGSFGASAVFGLWRNPQSACTTSKFSWRTCHFSHYRR